MEKGHLEMKKGHLEIEKGHLEIEKGHLEIEKGHLEIKRAFGNGKREIFYIINNLTFIQNLEIQVLKLMNKFYVYYLVFY
tara:strand:- start:189 stop:428 length:240 start_codon:yes stop_codon:yes gene_type:complete